MVTREGAVSEAVCGEACLILRFVSLFLACQGKYQRNRTGNSPVKIGSLDVAQAFWFTRADEDHVGGNKVVVFEADDVADLDVLPFFICECGLCRKDFGFARVKFRVGLMSFLRVE